MKNKEQSANPTQIMKIGGGGMRKNIRRQQVTVTIFLRDQEFHFACGDRIEKETLTEDSTLLFISLPSVMPRCMYAELLGHFSCKSGEMLILEHIS